MLQHLRAPDRLHHEGRHQHIAAEVRGEVREPSHELLLVAQQLKTPHLPLQPPEAQDSLVLARARLMCFRQLLQAVGLGPRLLIGSQEGVVEDLLAGEGVQSGRVGGRTDPHAHRPLAPASHTDPVVRPVNGRTPTIHSKLEDEEVLAVEGHVLPAHAQERILLEPQEFGTEPVAKFLNLRSTERRHMARTLGPRQPLEISDQPHELLRNEQREAERLQMELMVLEVALLSHRAQKEKSDVEVGNG